MYFFRNDIPETENERHTTWTGPSTSFIIHENWNGQVGNGFDIAIIKVDNQDNIVPVRLAEDGDFEKLNDNSFLTVLGFGQIDNSGTTPSHLKQSGLLQWLDCDVMANVGYFVEADNIAYRFPTTQDGIICFAATEGSDMCQGDSGGPLMMGSLQYGVNSYR